MKKILLILLILIFGFANMSYGADGNSTESTVDEQASSLGIRDFLKETKKYTKEFENDIDITEIFNSAIKGKVDNKRIIKKFLNLISSQMTDIIEIFINIIIIVLIHSLLKSLTDDLENNEVSKVVFYAEYILIVTVIMSNFSDILSSVKNTIENLAGFSESLIPLLVTLMVYTGSITTSSLTEPILLFLIEFITNCVENLIIPIVSIITVLLIISKITDRIQINKISSFMKSSIIWFLGILLTIFTGILSLEGTLTSSVDGITAKTTKAVVSSAIPIVRKAIRR